MILKRSENYLSESNAILRMIACFNMEKNKSLFLGLMLLFSSCKKEYVAHSEIVKSLAIDSLQTSNESIDETITPYRNALKLEMNKVIGENAEEITNNRPQLKLTNYVAQILFLRAKESLPEIDFSVMNSGGIRIPALPKGPVTVGKMYELMPFENQLWIVKLSGETTSKLVRKALDSKNFVLWNVRRDSSSASPQKVYINGKEFKWERDYYVALSDYLALGGDELSFLNETLEKKDLETKIRDVIIDFVSKESSQGRTLRFNLQ